MTVTEVGDVIAGAHLGAGGVAGTLTLALDQIERRLTVPEDGVTVFRVVVLDGLIG